MVCRHSLFVRKRCIVIVDHRFFLMQAVHPDPGLVYVVMEPFPFCFTEFLERAGGPLLERKGLLICLHKVIKANTASCQSFNFIQSLGQKIL